MKRAILLIISLIISFFIPMYPYEPVYTDKVAMVLIPPNSNDPMTYEQISNNMTNTAIAIFEQLGYTIMPIYGALDVVPIWSKQVVIFYVGHALETNLQKVRAMYGDIPLADLISAAHTPRLIMLTGTCLGGSWLLHAGPGRLIISASNDTVGMVLGTGVNSTVTFLPTTVLDLLFYAMIYPLEQAYEIWSLHMMYFYQMNYSPAVSIISDGIPGDVYL